MSAPSLLSGLREATREHHRALETLPYFDALERVALPLESCVAHLRAMAVLHGVLEHELSKSADRRCHAVWSDALRRLPRLQADSHFFAARGVLDIGPAHEAACTAASRLRRRSAECPVSLLGTLYVFEGSIRGAAVLAPKFRKAFALEGCAGLAYFHWESAEATERWQGFSARMNSLTLTESEHQALVAAAVETFEAMRRLFTALYPFVSEKLTRQVTTLNPEAGTHPSPDDPAELDAALRASERVWCEYPYLAWRYGERGWRFTQSDGAWLVTLATLEQPTVDAQVSWLVGVLASRGMPSLLVQRKLEVLSEELVGRVPVAGERGYGRLLAAADRLIDQRQAVLSDADLDAVASEFEARVGPTWRARLPGSGRLLACAVADRARGLAQAVASIEGWFADSKSFPEVWCAAVRDALREAETRSGRR